MSKHTWTKIKIEANAIYVWTHSSVTFPNHQMIQVNALFSFRFLIFGFNLASSESRKTKAIEYFCIEIEVLRLQAAMNGNLWSNPNKIGSK